MPKSPRSQGLFINDEDRVTTPDRSHLTTTMMSGVRVHFEIEIKIEIERGGIRVRGTQRRRVPPMLDTHTDTQLTSSQRPCQSARLHTTTTVSHISLCSLTQLTDTDLADVGAYTYGLGHPSLTGYGSPTTWSPLMACWIKCTSW